MPATYADRFAELEDLLRHLERRLSHLSRMASHAPAPNRVEKAGDVVANLLAEFADRFRGNTRQAGRDATVLGDDAIKLGRDAFRRVTREVEQRPLVTLAVAVGVGVIAAGLFARRA